jgi:signal transduction histidine kinase
MPPLSGENIVNFYDFLGDLPISTLIIDADAQILYANEMAHRFLGYEPLSLHSLGLETLVFRYKYLWQALKCKRNEGDILKLSCEFRHKQGQHLASEIIAVGGRKGCIGLYIWDMQDARRREKILKMKWQKAEKVNQAKSLFVSLVSHEFRTPMASIQAASDLLRAYWERLSPEEREKYLEQISADIFRMARMMDDILLLGKIQNGQLCLQVSLVDPLTLCREAIQFVQVYGGKSRVRVTVSEDFPSMWCIDPALFNYILVNLLSNALKYSPPDTKVVLTLRRDQNQLVLEVADKGIGIPVEDYGKIFHLFHRGTNVGTAKGIGVGMFMVKYCVDLHHGSIAFRSVLGSGTTFQVKLPAGP